MSKIESIASVVAASALVSACAGQCPPASQISGRTYGVFANAVTHTADNDALFRAPNFYAYGIPSNGAGTWTFQWNQGDNGPVSVVIDGQSFSGTGEWDNLECGYGVVEFGGVYVDEPTGVEHDFQAISALTFYADQVGGLLIWAENWSSPDGESGTFRSESHVTVSLTGGG